MGRSAQSKEPRRSPLGMPVQMRTITPAQMKELAATGVRFKVDGKEFDPLEIPKPKKKSILHLFLSELIQGLQNLITIQQRTSEAMCMPPPPPVVNVTVPKSEPVINMPEDCAYTFDIIRDKDGRMTAIRATPHAR